MNSSNNLVITGTQVPYNTSLELNGGWNIMGYLHQDPMDATYALDPIVESVVIVKDENGLVFWPAFGLNNIGNMMAGEGYQIKTNEEGGPPIIYMLALTNWRSGLTPAAMNHCLMPASNIM